MFQFHSEPGICRDAVGGESRVSPRQVISDALVQS